MCLLYVGHAKFFKCFRPIGQGEGSPHPCARLQGRVRSGGGVGGGGGGDVALNSLFRASLSLMLPLTCRALKELKMARLRVSF